MRMSLVAALLLAPLARAASPEPESGARLVSFQNGPLELHGFLYKPEGAGPFPAVLWNHGSEKKPGWAPELAKLYVSRGFVFFIPHRHGHGRSAGDYIGDLVSAVPTSAAKRRKMVELQDVYNEDVAAAVEFLKKQPFVDPRRMIMSGVSYGGIQTLLSAERGLGMRAYIPFAPGAMSWASGPEIRERLAQAVRAAKAPVFLIQAQNDYDLGPSEELGPEIDKLPFLHKRKVYPAFGVSNADGHGGFATKGGDVWGQDVFAFIDEALKAGFGK